MKVLFPSRTWLRSPYLWLVWMGWGVVFIFLLWQAAVRLTTETDLIRATGGDSLVRQSLQLAAVQAGWFIPYVLTLRAAVTAIFFAAAGTIFWRKRQDGFALAVSFLFMVTPFALVLSGAETPLANLLSMTGLLSAALLPFVFPDGRFVPQSVLLRSTLAGSLLLAAIITYPMFRSLFPEYGPGEWGYGSWLVMLLVLMAAGVLSQVYRYRRLSNPVQRQQTKWVMLGLQTQLLWIFWLVLWLTGILPLYGLPEPWFAFVMLHLTMISMAALPATVGFSILRYRLWEIDLIINRAVVFGGLTLLVAAGYVILVGLMGVLFQFANNLLLSVLATGLIAILFHPLRQRVQRTINRLMYGNRDDPVEVLIQLGKWLAHTAIPGETLPNLTKTIGQALKLPYVAIAEEKHGEHAAQIIAEYGSPPSQPVSFPLVYHNQVNGYLLAAPRSPGEVFTTAESRLLENIAQQAGAAMYADQLTRHLQHSRKQIITSREEERQRIRRDLHDGIGPQLATLSLKLDATRNYLTQNPEAADRLIQELKGQVQDAIYDIRRLVYDLRPPALDQHGLIPALQAHAAQVSTGEMQTRIEIPEPLPRLPAAVEVAAYRIALEAITNAARHASANQCIVKLSVSNRLCLDIEDDGQGFACPVRAGVGLTSMRERSEELGGTFNYVSIPGKGTTISVRIPI